MAEHRSKWFHTLLLLGWLAIGISLRFTNLGEKSASSIEISTLGFSNGHGFLQVPLNRVISLDTLLSPLRFDGKTSISDVMHYLMSESNHPPLYFVLTHLWMKLFVANGELASLWIGRSLSAILGAVSIPAMFGLGWLAFRSLLVGQIAAALMAVSPYSIYLAQEARHYTLTILWIIASVSCLVVAIRCLYHRIALPVWIGCVWIIVNSLGFATHYFFSLALCAEGIVVVGFWFRNFGLMSRIDAKAQRGQGGLGGLGGQGGLVGQGGLGRQPLSSAPLLPCPSAPLLPCSPAHNWRLFAVAAGTAIACLVWLPVIQASSHNELTEWIQTSYEIDQIWQPILRLLVWLLTMVFLLPVEGINIAIATISTLVILMVLLWVSPAVRRGILAQMASPLSRLSVQVLGGFFIGAIAIFLMIIYALGKDLSQAARYHFVYFPTVIVLLAAALAICWEEGSRGAEGQRGNRRNFNLKSKIRLGKFGAPETDTANFPQNPKSIRSFLRARGKKVVVVILLMGLLGAFTVVSNYGYQKSRRSDLLAAHIQVTSQAPALIAMTYETHAELRALIGLAVDFKRLADRGVESKSPLAASNSPEFLLVQTSGSKLIPSVATILTQLGRPLDLWAVNLKVDNDALEALNCHRDSRKPSINGYRYRQYHCR